MGQTGTHSSERPVVTLPVGRRGPWTAARGLRVSVTVGKSGDGQRPGGLGQHAGCGASQFPGSTRISKARWAPRELWSSPGHRLAAHGGVRAVLGLKGIGGAGRGHKLPTEQTRRTHPLGSDHPCVLQELPGLAAGNEGLQRPGPGGTAMDEMGHVLRGRSKPWVPSSERTVVLLSP